MGHPGYGCWGRVDPRCLDRRSLENPGLKPTRERMNRFSAGLKSSSPLLKQGAPTNLRVGRPAASFPVLTQALKPCAGSVVSVHGGGNVHRRDEAQPILYPASTHNMLHWSVTWTISFRFLVSKTRYSVWLFISGISPQLLDAGIFSDFSEARKSLSPGLRRSVRKHFQDNSAELQIPPLRSG
jgi:hypothetical protein